MTTTRWHRFRLPPAACDIARDLLDISVARRLQHPCIKFRSAVQEAIMQSAVPEMSLTLERSVARVRRAEDQHP